MGKKNNEEGKWSDATAVETALNRLRKEREAALNRLRKADEALWEEASRKEAELVSSFVSPVKSLDDYRRTIQGVDERVEEAQSPWRDWRPVYNRASRIPRGEVEVRLRDGRILRGKSYDFKWDRANQREDPFWEIVAWRPCT